MPDPGSSDRDVLAGCPGAEHFTWWLAAWTPGGIVKADQVTRHLLIPTDRVADADFDFEQAGSRGRAVSIVVGWRTTRFDQIVVTYQGVDGRHYDLVAEIDQATGRLVRPRAMRSANGADLCRKPIDQLTAEERTEVHGLFDAAYREANHAWLDRRLDGLEAIGMGWRNGSLAGFVASSSALEIDLPLVGPRRVMDGGITCVHPAAQGRGLANAIGQEMIRIRPGGDPDIVVNHFATPVTLRAMFHIGRYAWPGNSITEAAASLASPTPCQRSVGAALAERGGALDYDADHWVLRSGQPAGDSTTDPVDLEPEYQALFQHLNRSRGDTLLGVFWITEPPSPWWQ